VARFIADGLIGRRAGRIAPAFSPDQIRHRPAEVRRPQRIAIVDL